MRQGAMGPLLVVGIEEGLRCGDRRGLMGLGVDVRPYAHVLRHHTSTTTAVITRRALDTTDVDHLGYADVLRHAMPFVVKLDTAATAID